MKGGRQKCRPPYIMGKKKPASLKSLLRTHRVNGRIYEGGKCRIMLVNVRTGKPRVYTVKVN